MIWVAKKDFEECMASNINGIENNKSFSKYVGRPCSIHFSEAFDSQYHKISHSCLRQLWEHPETCQTSAFHKWIPHIWLT